MFEIDPSYADAVRLGGRLAEPYQTLTRRKRQRLEKNRIDRAENGCVCADSDSQSQDDDEREHALSPDTSHCVTEVLKKRFKSGELPRLIASLADGGRITKVALRCSTRLFQRHAPFQVFIDQELQMGFNLLLQFSGKILPSSERTCYL